MAALHGEKVLGKIRVGNCERQEDRDRHICRQMETEIEIAGQRNRQEQKNVEQCSRLQDTSTARDFYCTRRQKHFTQTQSQFMKQSTSEKNKVFKCCF
jgi:hypothetical protein